MALIFKTDSSVVVKEVSLTTFCSLPLGEIHSGSMFTEKLQKTMVTNEGCLSDMQCPDKNTPFCSNCERHANVLLQSTNLGHYTNTHIFYQKRSGPLRFIDIYCDNWQQDRVTQQQTSCSLKGSKWEKLCNGHSRNFRTRSLKMIT